MKMTNFISFCVILFFSHFAIGQKDHYKKDKYRIVEIHTYNGFSNNFAPLGNYRSIGFSGVILIEQKSFASVQGFGISLGKYGSDDFGFKFSLGVLEYGFDYEGRTAISNILTSDAYRVTYVDISAGVMHRIWKSETAELRIEGGFHRNTNSNSNSRTINLSTKNSHSISFDIGAESPMPINNLFVYISLHFRFPLQRFNYRRTPDTKFKPYFMGFKLGTNYQF